jgi:signal transduction histidine kinase
VRRLAVGHALRARLVPIAVLVFAVVSLSAPLAMYALRLHGLRSVARTTGRSVAELIVREADERPALWRYDTLKLVDHVRAYRVQADVVDVEVVDHEGEPIGVGHAGGVAAGGEREGANGSTAGAQLAALWEPTPIVIHDETVGHVWVGVSTVRARQNALLLLLPFALLGAMLAGLLYAVPMRSMGHAERRIVALVGELEGSRAALATLNQSLEQQVAERSSELRRAYAELVRKEERLREISRRAIALSEGERRAIGRELHDSVGQALTAIRIHLTLLGDLVASGAPGAAARAGTMIAQSISMTDETLEEIRRAVMRLGPAILDEIGLAEALERYCDDFAERSRIEVRRSIEAGGGPLSQGVEGALYRIAQEALTNVAKHAGAASVSVELTNEGGAVVLAIEDDGAGFVPGSPEASGGHGLPGMRERVELLGGTLKLASEPGKGTKLRVELPAASAEDSAPSL